MLKVTVNVKKLSEKAVLPKRGSDYAAGADLYSADLELTVAPGETVFVHTGLSFEIPEGYVGLIFARSGLSCKQGLAPANKVGVIDSDYRGEVMVALHNHSNQSRTLAQGERVAQMVIIPYLAADFCEADQLNDTVRGTGGFGSTGRM